MHLIVVDIAQGSEILGVVWAALNMMLDVMYLEELPLLFRSPHFYRPTTFPTPVPVAPQNPIVDRIRDVSIMER